MLDAFKNIDPERLAKIVTIAAIAGSAVGAIAAKIYLFYKNGK